jgi:hypothetical protein
VCAACILWASSFQRDLDIKQARIYQLIADSVAQSHVTRKFARWHWQLDTLSRSQLDSVVKSDKRKRVVKHIANPK